jgi:glycosyltransferase involved in cell wall biosynthesis
MGTTISVIIPTFNEAVCLPALLDSLHAQTNPPEEIIVADAGSSDDTVEIACRSGCRVVPGGRPAVGRNAGAAVARGDILVFLDADVQPPPPFLARSLFEFETRKLAVATCRGWPYDGKFEDILLHEIANWYIHMLRPFSPRAPGFCLFSRYGAHEAVNGFDETLWLAEDHDYVRRIAYHGQFGILHDSIPVSVRRLESDGRFNIAARYSLIELNLLLFGTLYQPLFDCLFGEYRFGHHFVGSAGSKTLFSMRRHETTGPVYFRFVAPVGQRFKAFWQRVPRRMQFLGLSQGVQLVQFLLGRNRS